MGICTIEKHGYLDDNNESFQFSFHRMECIRIPIIQIPWNRGIAGEEVALLLK